MNNSYNHNHSHKMLNTTGGRLLITMILNFVITVAEFVGGIVSGSLALISDALHNFSDGISVIITYTAIKLKQRDNSYKHTFGLKRAEILAAVINSAVLIVICFYLFYEAVMRFFEPHQIEAGIMTVIASIGLVANVAGTLLLKRDAKNSLNIRSAYFHLLSDTVSSIAVILGGIAIVVWKLHWVDPLLTILIGLYIIRESYLILGEAIHVLMEGAPPDVDVERIKHEVEIFDEVDKLHHVHMWMVGENDIHFEAHVNIHDMKISENDILRKKIENVLQNKFGIHYITLQFECNQCSDEGIIGQHK